jgi:hypothetical protein
MSTNRLSMTRIVALLIAALLEGKNYKNYKFLQVVTKSYKIRDPAKSAKKANPKKVGSVLYSIL